MPATGNGPPCPVDPSHGKTYAWEGHEFLCPHSAHGGNGRFFTDKEAHGGYELKEGDVSLVIEAAARDVVEGKQTLDVAVQNVARHTKMATSQAREAVRVMIDTIKEKDEDMADKRAAAKAEAKKAATTPKTGERKKLEQVAGAEYARVRDEAGLTQHHAQLACAEAGMGASATYVYILTHQGASVKLFERFKDAVASYARKHKAELVAERKAAEKAVSDKAKADAKPAAAAKASKAPKAAAPAKAAAAPKKKAPAAAAAASA